MNQKITSIAIVCAMLLMGISINIDSGAQGAFVNYQSVPWTSDFTPLDSAWDPAGDNCVVVGNDTSGLQSSAWHFYEPTNTWSPIFEGTDASSPAANVVVNDNTSMTYGSIQSAIDAASSGNVLEVWSGTYYENIAINKMLTIIGNGSANTIIDGGNADNVVHIGASNVEFSGFSVTGSTLFSGYAGILLFNSDNCNIHDNYIYDNYDGIRLEGSSNNIITENDVENNEVGIITASSPETKSLMGVSEDGGSVGYGAMYELDTDGSNFDVIREFLPEHQDGRNPYYNAALTLDMFDLNTLYGTTRYGGSHNAGIIFRTDVNGASYDILFNFTASVNDGRYPTGDLLQIGDELYGMCNSGGSSNYGTIFKIRTDGSDFEVLHSFTGGAGGSSPQYGGLVYDGSSIYGMTYNGGTIYGTIFQIYPDGSGFTILHNFDSANGEYPYGSLTVSGGMLYGMTRMGGLWDDGVIFKIDTSGGGYTVLREFGPTFYNPYGNLLIIGSNLYGMVYNGPANYGGVFTIDIWGGGFNVLHSFAGGVGDGGYPYGSLVHDGSGMLYGTTRSYGANSVGTIFKVSTDGLTYNLITSFTGTAGVAPGSYSGCNLIYDGGWLYGTTQSGGTTNDGTIFKVRWDGSLFTSLHNFDDATNGGTYPKSNLLQSGDYIYGVTNNGGIYGSGTLYKMNIDKTGYTIMHHFNSVDGSNGDNPYSEPIQVGGTLYGTTYDGGVFGQGTIYKIETDGTGFSLLHSFQGGLTDGASPYSGLTYDGSFLYGATRNGGPSNYGSVYRINTGGFGYTTMHLFGGVPDGEYPGYGKLLDDGVFLYGTTTNGGMFDRGTVFKIAKATSIVTILHNFTSVVSDAQYPYGGLVSDGTYLYGMTSSGGVYGDGTVYRVRTDGSNFGLMHHFDYNADGGYPEASLTLDGNTLYGVTSEGGDGVTDYGTVFKIDKDTAVFTLLRYFQGNPGIAYPYGCGIAMITYPAADSWTNLIYHNNLIDNTIQAWDNMPIPGNAWDNGLPDGGNYWNDYGGVDMPPNGIGDSSYFILGGVGASDDRPWMRENGWKLPYTSLLRVKWDDVNERFWMCGEYSTNAASSIYYVQNGSFDAMVPIEAPTITFTALEPDNLGAILLGGNNLDAMYYYDGDNGHEVTEIGTTKMWGWNITDIAFNPNDDRFYVVGNQMNQDKGVAFHTDEVPLDSGSANCYLDTSTFINTPPGKLKAIDWNPVRDYALVVGDGIYRMDIYDGNPGYELTWTEIEAASAGITFSDVSWDSDGWNEAGISGDDSTFGTYWRYYHTNPNLQNGFTNSTAGTEYTTCAMKPPSSPKWLLLLGGAGGLQINIEELDQSSTVSASSINPNVYWVGFNDTAMNPKNNQVISPDSSFYITFEGNYSGGWDQVSVDIDMWYDFGFIGTNSMYPVETDFNRNKAFSLTYTPAAFPPIAVNYPNGPVMEFQTGTITDIVSIPHPTMPAYSTHRVEIEILLGAQMFAADGSGSMGIGPDYHSDPNIALDRANTWDFNVNMTDIGDPTKFNSTYGEFGVNKAISISITGDPGADGTPGTNGVYLGSNTIEYSTNTNYWVNVSIPNLYLYGNEASPYFITADKLQVENTNGLSYLPLVSDIDAATYFQGADLKWCVWGSSAGGSLQAPGNGTTAHGPWGSNYNNYGSVDGSTTVEWYVDLPGALAAGTYEATISYSIETEG